MAENLHSCDHADEDYIDMEVSSHSQFINQQTTNSPSHSREFEFQMFSNLLERETTTSPADELFYKGKLLPLHLPPRLQMVQKLLQNSNSYDHKNDNFEEFFSTPLTTNPKNTPESNTPFESCNNSPSQSCRISRELNPDEYFCDFSSETIDCISANPNKSRARKLKLIKQSSIGSKLKASRAYLKAMFGISGCSVESCNVATRNVDKRSISKTNKDGLNEYIKAAKRAPFGQISTTNREKISEDHGGRRHRRSISGAMKRLSTTKISSSSSSSSSSSDSSWSNSNGFLNRSSSVNSDIESSIQGAIAHCKKSQYFQSRKIVSEVGLCSLSASRKVSQDQERPGHCRG